LVQLSFTDWNGYSKNIDYVGFENYIKVLSQPEYIAVFLNNFAYIISGFVMVFLAAYIAIVLDSDMIRGRNLFRTIIFHCCPV
jgi:multiple sugar transport system permease protein